MCQATGKQTETEKADRGRLVGGRERGWEGGRERWRAEKDKEVGGNGQGREGSKCTIKCVCEREREKRGRERCIDI